MEIVYIGASSFSFHVMLSNIHNNLLYSQNNYSLYMLSETDNFNYASAAKRRARIIGIIRALEGRNVWNTYGMT